MKDGSDAVGDWAILNALINTSAGASWVVRPSRRRRRHGLLACMPAWSSSRTAPTKRRERLQRVLTSDPGMGVIRHVDAGYDEAVETAEKHGIRVPMRE